MIKINLVAEGRKPIVKRPPVGGLGAGLPALAGEQVALYSLLAAGLLCGLAYGIWWWTIKGTVDENAGKIRVASQRVAELQEYIDKVEEFERRQDELEQKIDVITELKNSQRGPVEIMDQISRALPELLWVDRIDQRGKQITVSGRAFNNTAIENFIRRLDDSPYFEEPKLNDITQIADAYRYTLVLTKVTPSEEEDAA